MFEGKWENNEVIDLFRIVEEVKAEKKSIKEAFLVHANKYQRRPNSVRNYYYHEVDDLLKNKNRQKELEIDLAKHKKQEVKFFSEKEGDKIVEEINKLVKNGNSVRQACLKLSGGNVALMLRYQNKYRNYRLKKNEVTKTVNILDFKNKQKSLTDFDISSLFNGLVKLIKKSAYEEADFQVRKEKESLKFLLKKTLVELTKKEKEFEEIKERYKSLEDENKSLLQKLSNLRVEKAKILTEKLSSLKKSKLGEIN